MLDTLQSTPHRRVSLIFGGIPADLFSDRTNSIHLALFPIQFIHFGGRGANDARDNNLKLTPEYLETAIAKVPCGSFTGRLDV